MRLSGKHSDKIAGQKGQYLRLMSKINIEVFEENQDWNRCIDDNSLTLGRCVYNCQNNEQCEEDCLARFKIRQLDCPCEVTSLE